MIRTALVVLHMCCAHMFYMCFACIPHTHTYICVALRATYVWLLLSVCFAYVLIAFHSCFGFISPMFFLMFYLRFTNAIRMSHICFAYVSRVLLVLYIRFYFRVMARWLKILVTNDWTYAVHVPKVQESIYSENGFGTAGTARFGRWSLVVHPIFEAITRNWTQLANCFTVGLLHRHGLCVHCTGLWILPLVGVRSPLG